MITSQGKNGPKIIHVDIVRPLPVIVPTETELETKALHAELDLIEEAIKQGAELDGIIDRAKEAYKKAKAQIKKVKDAATEKAKKVINKAKGGDSSHHEVKGGDKAHHDNSQHPHPAGQATIQLPEKLYKDIEDIDDVMKRLLDVLLNQEANKAAAGDDSSGTPDQQQDNSNPPQPSGTETRPCPVYYLLPRGTRNQISH